MSSITVLHNIIETLSILFQSFMGFILSRNFSKDEIVFNIFYNFLFALFVFCQFEICSVVCQCLNWLSYPPSEDYYDDANQNEQDYHENYYEIEHELEVVVNRVIQYAIELHCLLFFNQKKNYIFNLGPSLFIVRLTSDVWYRLRITKIFNSIYCQLFHFKFE